MSKQNLLIVDLGNSVCKWFVVAAKPTAKIEPKIIISNKILLNLSSDITGDIKDNAKEARQQNLARVTNEIDNLFKQISIPKLDAILLVNVNSDIYINALKTICAKHSQAEFIAIGSQASALNVYSIPEQFGVDRFLCNLAAKEICSKDDANPDAFIVLDLGTAFTFDFVYKGQHQGGYILPGENLLLQTLNLKTANLLHLQQAKKKAKNINNKGADNYFGKNTKEAIYNAIDFVPLDFLIQRLGYIFSNYNPMNLTIFITGGKGDTLLANLKKSELHTIQNQNLLDKCQMIFSPNLVMQGAIVYWYKFLA